MDFSPSLLWFLAGVAFLIAELFIPGIILIFFTAGCWITGIAVSAFHIDKALQILLSIITSLILLFTLRRYCIRIFKGAELKDIDSSHSDSKIGKRAVVTENISSVSAGEIKFMGSFWRASSDYEIKEGQTVVIRGQDPEDGLTFKVTPIQGDNDE